MPAHWVMFTLFAWGHLRPESNLAVTLARKFPEVTISFIADADFSSMAQDEITRNASLGAGDPKDILSRIRVIALGRTMAGMTPELGAMLLQMDPRHIPTTPPVVVQRVQAAFDDMMLGKPVTDDHGRTWDAVGAKPGLMICDFMMGWVCPALHEKYGLPLYVWSGWSASAWTRQWGPTESGGKAPTYVAECHAIEADETLRKGRSFSQIASDVWTRSANVKDDIIRIKGLPPFYQWEDVAQHSWYPMYYDSVATTYPMIQRADGLLFPTVPELEPEAVKELVEYSAKLGRKVLCLGPQLPSEYFLDSSRNKSNLLSGTEVKFSYVWTRDDNGTQTGPCIAFLDQALQECGQHSAIYISFGSTFFPQPTHLQFLLECLLALDKPMPFIITTASPHAFLPDDLKKKIEESGRGLIVPWAPQQAILMHPALGWIVTHCGGGGTFESLSAGVPVIAWPFIADQPIHALWMSEVLDTAFELLQVRYGPHTGKAYRGGPNGTEVLGTEEAIKREMRDVLRMCQGEVGERKRENAQKARRTILDARKPGGQIDQDLETLRAYAA